jgi:hypothetical protein
MITLAVLWYQLDKHFSAAMDQQATVKDVGT